MMNVIKSSAFICFDNIPSAVLARSAAVQQVAIVDAEHQKMVKNLIWGRI